MTPLALSVRCSGCPPPAEGAALGRDVAIARAVLEGSGSVPPGWSVAGPPPPASQDVADGNAEPVGAKSFVACMGLDGAQAADVMHNADQVLNRSGPPLSLDSPGTSGPVATMSRWVDMVASRADAKRDWGIYASLRFPGCAYHLFGSRQARIGKVSRQSGLRAQAGASRAVLTRRFSSLPDRARGLEVELGGARGRASFVVGLATVGRVQASAVVDFAEPGVAGAENPYSLVAAVLEGMVERAVAAGVRPGT